MWFTTMSADETILMSENCHSREAIAQRFSGKVSLPLRDCGKHKQCNVWSHSSYIVLLFTMITEKPFTHKAYCFWIYMYEVRLGLARQYEAI